MNLSAATLPSRRAFMIATTIFMSGGARFRKTKRCLIIIWKSGYTGYAIAPNMSGAWALRSIACERNRITVSLSTMAIDGLHFSPEELMVCQAARQLRDGEVVFVGIGLPNLACNLARRLHAPKLVLIYESGAVGADPKRLPISIGDPSLVTNSLGVFSMFDVFSFYLQRGLIDVGFLQGVQIDRFGNLNTTVIGDYQHPKVRLPGSGGACEIAIL